MDILFNNKCFGNESYETRVYINDNLVDVKYDSEGKMKFTCENSDIVEIRISNLILNSKYFFVLFIFYWIVSLITSTGEQHPFGYPCDLLLALEASDIDRVNISTDNFFSDKPFICYNEKAIRKNCFIFSKKIKRRWILGEVVPPYICALFILLLIIFVEFQSKYILMKILLLPLPVVYIIWWTSHNFKILRKIRKNAK